MRRGSVNFLVGLLLCAGPAIFAQRSGIELHGIPASVTSPGVDGRPRGIAASVTDPTFTRSLSATGQHSGARPGHHHRPSSGPIVAVPYGYYGLPYYDDGDYEAQAQPPAPQPQVIVVKEEPSDARDEDSRYGQHSFDPVDNAAPDTGRDRVRYAQPVSPAEATAQEESPMTTLVYLDGHKSEVRNYAIVGSNLIDLTKSPIMKKIPLSSLNLDATRRENEENGIDFHLP